MNLMSFEICNQLQNIVFFLLVELLKFNVILCNQDKLHKKLYYFIFCEKTLNAT